MAIFHSHTQVIGRSSGRSALAAAAYRSASSLVEYTLDSETGIVSEQVWDYSKKSGVVFSKIFVPEGFEADWMQDRELLWNIVTAGEKRKDSRYSREFDIALPIELSESQNAELLTQIVKECFVSKGMIADTNMHYDDPNNPHAHVMLSMRDLIKLSNGQIGFGLKNISWEKNAFVIDSRRIIASVINQHLEMHGHDARVSHLSHKARGIELEPTIHVGPAGMHMRNADRKAINDEIIKNNARKITINPDLVIDKLSINKPVFTTKDIERELHNALIFGAEPNSIKSNFNPQISNGINGSNKLNDGELNGDKVAKDSKSFSLDSATFQGAKLNAKEQFLAAYSSVLSSAKLTMVNSCDLKGRMLFARTKQVNLEHKLEEAIRVLAERSTPTTISIKSKVTEEEIRKSEFGKKLSAEQVNAVLEITSGKDLSVLEGFPGAGKTTVMREVTRIMKSQGYNVIGTAQTNKACQELSKKIGIDVANTVKLRQSWQQQKGFKADLNLQYNYYEEEQYKKDVNVIPNNTVLIIDEASQLDTVTMDYFLNEAVKSNTKVIMLGDNNQNPAIGAKGGFAKAGNIAGKSMLTEINRHKNPDVHIRNQHIAATQALGNYEVSKAISIYESLGMIKLHDNEDLKRLALVKDAVEKIIELSSGDSLDSHNINYRSNSFIDSITGNKVSKTVDLAGLRRVAIGAYTNEEVSALNSLVRDRLKQAGIVKGDGQLYRSAADGSKSEMIELALGDQIIFKRNKEELNGFGGVSNNEIGVVTKIGRADDNGYGEFEVKVREGDQDYRTVRIKVDGTERFPVSFKHGYALTNYALQGATIDHKFYSIDKHSGFEAFNVGATRHEIDCKFYADKVTLENEVYKTKDLDVAKARENFDAYGYSSKNVNADKNIGIDENGYSNRTEVPLWKIGLHLLASKRTDLNFAKDYSYRSVENDLTRELKAVRQSVEVARDQLASHHEFLSTWETTMSMSSRADTANIGGRIVFREIGGTITNNSNNKHNSSENELTEGFLPELEKYFNLESTQELEVDARSIMSAKDLFKQVKASEGKSLTGWHDLERGVKEHVTSLKMGAMTAGASEALEWSSLSKLSQNLVLYTLLSKEDKKQLKQTIKASDKHEARIEQGGKHLIELNDQLTKAGREDNKSLQGNLGAVREYVESRERVQAAIKAIEVHDKTLNSSKLKSHIRSTINNQFGHVHNLDDKINATKVVEAKLSFTAEHFSTHSAEINSLKQGQPTAEVRSRLNELFDVRGARGKYLTKQIESLVLTSTTAAELAIQPALTDKDKALLIAHVLDAGTPSNAQSFTKSLFRETEAAVLELKAASKDRNNQAKVIVEHYDGHVGGDRSQAKMGNLIIQLGMSYETIQKHAGISTHKHYFKAKEEKSNLTQNDHYGLIINTLNKIKNLSESGAVLNEQEVKDLSAELHSSHQALQDSITMTSSTLAQVDHDIEQITLEKESLEDQRDDSADYSNKLFPEYLRRIYNATPESVMQRWQSLVKQEGLNFALSTVKKNPAVLNPKLFGSLKGVGIGKSLGFNNSRIDALTNIEVIGKRLEKYEESIILEKAANKELAAGNFEDKLKDMKLEKEELMLLLPTKEEANLLRLVEKTISVDKTLDENGNSNMKALYKLANNEEIEEVIFEHHNKQAKLSISKDQAQAQQKSQDQAQGKNQHSDEEKNKEHIEATSSDTQERTQEQGQSKQVQDLEKALSTKLHDINADENTKANVRTRAIEHNKQQDMESSPTLKLKERRITYAEVEAALGRSNYEQIFRQYAHAVGGGKDKILVRGQEISSGSTNMNLKNGLWTRFSTGQKGNIFQFIEEGSYASKVEALNIAAGYAGINRTEYTHSNGQDTDQQHNKYSAKRTATIDLGPAAEAIRPTSTWLPHTRVPANAPALDMKLLVKNEEVAALYPYKNSNGELLGYVARIVDKTGDKKTLPVSYCSNEVENKSEWRFKGFIDKDSLGTKPIYGAEKIDQDLKPILIVEGEKAADRASELLPEYTVLSWLGGSNSADKANWSKLKGREVVIWPDNDEPGFKAAASIKAKLNLVNGYAGMVSVVNPNQLELADQIMQSMPPELFKKGWDLADQLPEGINMDNIRAAIQGSRDQVKLIDKSEAIDNQLADLFSGDAHGRTISQRTLWQARSKGESPRMREVLDKTTLEKQWSEKLSSSEALYYAEYGKVTGKAGASHEHLDLKDGLYRDTLVAIASSMSVDLKERENLSSLNTPELVDRLQESYTSKLQDFVSTEVNELRLNSKPGQQPALGLNSNYDGNYSGGSKEEDLGHLLSRDLKFLHHLQLGSRLTATHNKAIDDLASSAVKDVRVDSPQAIARETHSTVNDKNWWKKLATTELGLADNKRAKVDKALHVCLKAERESIDKFKQLDPKYDLNALSSKLRVLHPREQIELVENELYGVFKKTVLPQLALINKEKKLAESTQDMIKALSKERDFCVDVQEQHWKLCSKLSRIDKNDQISMISHIYRQEPDLLHNLSKDIATMHKTVGQPEIRAMAELQYRTPNQAATEIFNMCQSAAVNDTHRDLAIFKEHHIIEKDGQRFNSIKSYLEHQMADPHQARYLTGTSVDHTLNSIHKDELHRQQQYQNQQQQQQQQKTLEKELEHTISKDIGM